MNAVINPAGTLDARVSLKQVGNIVSSPKAIFKHSLKQISDTEVLICNISASDFDNIFRFEIIDIIGNEFSDQIVFRLNYSDAFIITLELNGYWELDNEPKFQLTHIDWTFEEVGEKPVNAFLLKTFKAFLCLSNNVKVEIPKIKYFFKCTLPLTLNKISEILQNRQLAYRLMVIEKTFKVPLTFPKRFIEGHEVADIAFCYHSIIEREFEWPCNELTFFPTSTEKFIDLLPPTNTAFPLKFPTQNEIKEIFGKRLNLGQFWIEIPKAIVENYEEASEKLKKLNGEKVKVIIKSETGLMKYTTIDLPELSDKAFGKNLKQYFNLDEKFNSLFLDRYFNLASSTLEGLSEKQKKAITKRPELSFKFSD